MTDQARIDGRKLRYVHRRGELLEAATDYVLANGVAALAFRPLAKELGVSPSVFSHHFGTKEGLVTAILGLIAERMQRAQAGPDGPRADLDDYDAWWYRWASDESLPILRLTFEVIGMAMRTPERFELFRANATTGWVKVVEAQLAAAGCPADELQRTATSLVAHTTGLQVDLLLTGDRARVDAAHAAFVELIDERRRAWSAARA